MNNQREKPGHIMPLLEELEAQCLMAVKYIGSIIRNIWR